MGKMFKKVNSYNFNANLFIIREHYFCYKPIDNWNLILKNSILIDSQLITFLKYVDFKSLNMNKLFNELFNNPGKL